MQVNHRTLAPIHCASTDETRFAINTLSFESSGEVIATNGHIMARFIPSEKPDPELAPFVIGAKSVDDLNRQQRKKSTEPLTVNVAAANENGHVIFESPDPDQCAFGIAKLDNVEFPNWRSVHPYVAGGTNHEPQHKVGISLAMLEPIVAAARQFSETRKGAGTLVRFEFGENPESPFVAIVDDTGSGDRLELIVMPMRLDK